MRHGFAALSDETGATTFNPETHVGILDLEAFDAKPLTRDPFDFVIVDNFIRPTMFKDVMADFPRIPGPGSHPPAELSIKGRFKALLDELEGQAFRSAVERKFDLDLSGRPTMYTVRGFVAERDGRIHTDSKTKIITVLLYLNEGWEADGGRLRLLRSGEALDNPVAEVSPNEGTLLVFRRSDVSWHGHKTFKGQRRAIQMNWVTGADVVVSEQRRHAFATRIKKLKNMFLPMTG
jgi:SM-20-related protein